MLRLHPLDRTCVERLLSSQPHLVQNSLTWFDFIRSFSGENDRSLQFEEDGKAIGFLLALQHRRLIQSLPYPASYSGPLFAPGTSPRVQLECMELALDNFKERADVVSVCATPIMERDNGWSSRFEFRAQNQIQVIDLTQPLLSGTTSKFRNNLQRNLRKAADAGVSVDFANSKYDLELWYDVYRGRAAELGAPLLPLAFFLAMREHLEPAGNFRLVSARQGDEYLGGIIIVYNGHCADYYLSMFARRHDALQASTAAFNFMLSWAHSQGIRYLNLQASPASQPDLIRFKAAWGAQAWPQSYFVSILNNRDKVLQTSVDQIRNDYLFHFFVPFAALTVKTETARDREVTHAH